MRASPHFPRISLPHLDAVRIPQVARVHLRQPEHPALPDVAGGVRRALAAQTGLFDLPEGAQIAVAVGSRGIADIDKVARASVDWLKGRGFAPFIVPGMGSHGGGTAAGQEALLAALGVSEKTMGCPVRATMDTVDYGIIDGGLACHFDANAAAADGILVINRVKAHTSFPRPIESGLTKMLAVGLGKAQGARQVHMRGTEGLATYLPRLADRIIERAPLCAGLALVENAHKALMHIEAVAPTDFAAADARLLTIAKSTMARLPFRQLDALVIERLGKDISGAGIDPAISGRTDIRGVENPSEPFIHKVTVLGMTKASKGNAIGIGVTDFIPLALANSLDLESMYMNAVTATFLEKAFIPVVLPDDQGCVRASVATCWRDAGVRLCQIASSAHLDKIAVSAPLLDELREGGHVLEEGPLEAMTFDADGALTSRLRP